MVNVIYGPGGDPLPEAQRMAARRTAAMSVFHGARSDHASLAGWRAPRVSGQAAVSADRQPLTDRINDLVRNNGWASAAVTRFLDNIVGSGWTLSAKPDHVALGIEREAADAIGDRLEALWRGYAQHDKGFWCDAERIGPAASVLGRAVRSRFSKGEIFGLMIWRPAPTGYATGMHVIDPQRVSNPRGLPDTASMRDGIEVDGWDAAIAYHVQKSHPGDIWTVTGGNFFQWDRIERDTDWGRPVVVHCFDPDEPGQKRGVSSFAPILRKLKQITDYDDYELQAAALNAVLALFITTPFDPDDLLDNLGSEGTGSAIAQMYQAQREAQDAYYSAAPVSVQGAQVNLLQPGEVVNSVKPEHPNTGFEPFVTAGLRAIASAVGTTYEQLTMDWSRVNYSSARAALIEIYKSFAARKSGIATQFMGPWYHAWLEEVFDAGLVDIPAGAPSFEAMPQAWSACDWIGVGRGWVDPKREAEGAQIRLDNGISTLERECAEQGQDWKQVAEQRAREQRFITDIGLAPAKPRAASPQEGEDDPDRDIEADVNGRDRETTDAA